MNQMFRLRDDYEDDDDDHLDEEEESQAPSQARAASFSLHSSDTSVDDDEMEENENNANRIVIRNERMARRVLRNAGVAGAAAAAVVVDDDDDAPMVVRMLQPVGLLWAQPRPGAPAVRVAKQPSWWQPRFGSHNCNLFSLVARLVQGIIFKIDAIIDGAWHGVQSLRREFQTLPHEIPFFGSNAPIGYIMCIVGAVHCLGMMGLAQYYNHYGSSFSGEMENVRKIDHWCTLVTCAALLAVTLPTMSAPGVLTRCHVSAWLVFVGAVLFAVGVDQEFVGPLSFTKEYCVSSLYDNGATATTHANVWQLLDINKVVQWMVLSFLCLLPHALGSTSSAAGNFACFVLGWFLSSAAVSLAALSRFPSHSWSRALNLSPNQDGVHMVLFWTGIFILNAPALIQYYVDNVGVIPKTWGYRRLVLAFVCGPCLVYNCCLMEGGMSRVKMLEVDWLSNLEVVVPISSFIANSNRTIYDVPKVRNQPRPVLLFDNSQAKRSVTSPIPAVERSWTSRWNSGTTYPQTMSPPAPAPMPESTTRTTSPQIPHLAAEASWTSRWMTVLNPRVMALPPADAPVPPPMDDVSSSSSSTTLHHTRKGWESTLALPITPDLLLGQWN
jgi:hypothetical protein